MLYTIQFDMSISSQFCLVLDIPTGPAMCAASLPYQRPPAARGEGLGHGPNKIGKREEWWLKREELANWDSP
jgi:hypothetical protein